jgi:hypothetical protein
LVVTLHMEDLLLAHKITLQVSLHPLTGDGKARQNQNAGEEGGAETAITPTGTGAEAIK